MNKKIARILAGAVFSAAFIGFAAPGMAQLTPAQQQAVDLQTGTASPGREPLRRMGEDEFVPRVTPRVDVKKLEIQNPPPGADKIEFELGGIKLEGVTVYSPAELRTVYANRIGATITLADLYVIAGEMTRKYRNDGYILTQVVVPPQTIEGGIARLQVVEGVIDRVDVRGPTDGTMDLVRAYADRMIRRDGGALNTKDLERALLLINDLPGIDARAVLNPSKEKTGAADIMIIVERKPYDAQIGIDNFGTRFLGPVQLSAAGSLNSPFHANERISAQFVGAPGGDHYHEMLYGALTYERPVWTAGTMLELFGAYTHTTPGYTLDQFDVEGWSTYASAKLTHPFIRSRSLNLNGYALFDHREVRSQNNIPVDPTRKDHIRAVRVGGTYEMLDTFLGVGFNTANVELSQGLHIFGANNEGSPTMSRPAADISFTKITAEIQRLQRVTKDVNLLLGVTGQLANDALLSSEEFGVGGISYGRGYDSSEIIGDDGLAGKVEAQWTEPYRIDLLDSYQLYGFYDVGKVWNKDATTSSDKIDSIASTGAGIRADFNESTNGGFMVAFPLTATPQTDNNKSPRIYVNLYHKF